MRGRDREEVREKREKAALAEEEKDKRQKEEEEEEEEEEELAAADEERSRRSNRIGKWWPKTMAGLPTRLQTRLLRPAVEFTAARIHTNKFLGICHNFSLIR